MRRCGLFGEYCEILSDEAKAGLGMRRGLERWVSWKGIRKGRTFLRGSGWFGSSVALVESEARTTREVYRLEDQPTSYSTSKGRSRRAKSMVRHMLITSRPTVRLTSAISQGSWALQDPRASSVNPSSHTIPSLFAAYLLPPTKLDSTGPHIPVSSFGRVAIAVTQAAGANEGVAHVFELHTTANFLLACRVC